MRGPGSANSDTIQYYVAELVLQVVTARRDHPPDFTIDLWTDRTFAGWGGHPIPARQQEWRHDWASDMNAKNLENEENWRTGGQRPRHSLLPVARAWFPEPSEWGAFHGQWQAGRECPLHMFGLACDCVFKHTGRYTHVMGRPGLILAPTVPRDR